MSDYLFLGLLLICMRYDDKVCYKVVDNTTDDSLLKMLYLAMIDITKKWTCRRQDWRMIHSQLAVYFEDRIPY